MTLKDEVMSIIKNNDILNEIYEDKTGCFRNITIQNIDFSNNADMIVSMIEMLAIQSKIYDTLLNDIAEFGDQNLLNKCRKDIMKILSVEE